MKFSTIINYIFCSILVVILLSSCSLSRLDSSSLEYLDKVKDKNILNKILEDEEFVNFLNDYYSSVQNDPDLIPELINKTAQEGYSIDEIKQIIINSEGFLDYDDSYMNFFINRSVKYPGFTDFSIEEVSKVFEELGKNNYPEKYLDIFFELSSNILISNDENTWDLLLFNPMTVQTNNFLDIVKEIFKNNKYPEIVELVNSQTKLNNFTKLYLFKKLKDTDIIDFINKFDSLDPTLFKEIFNKNPLGFLSFYFSYGSKVLLDDFISFSNNLKDKDPELYNSYLEYDPSSIYALKNLSAYTDENKLLEFRPTPQSVLKLSKIIDSLPEEERKNYVENSLKSSYAIIISGSKRIGANDIFRAARLYTDLNIPYFIISNSDLNEAVLDTIYDKDSSEAELLQEYLKLMNGEKSENIKILIKKKKELKEIISELIEAKKTEILNIFLITHGSPDSLSFGDDTWISETPEAEPEYLYDFYPEDIKNTFSNKYGYTNLLLSSCNSGSFSKKLSGIDGLRIISSTSTDMITSGLDFINAIIIANKLDDYRITQEELKQISNGVGKDYGLNEGEPVCYDPSKPSEGYIYNIGGFVYSIYDRINVDVFHDFGDGDLDISFTNIDDVNNTLYYHLSSLDESEIDADYYKGNLYDIDFIKYNNSLHEEISSYIPIFYDMENISYDFGFEVPDFDNSSQWIIENPNDFLILDPSASPGPNFAVAVNDSYFMYIYTYPEIIQYALMPVDLKGIREFDFLNRYKLLEELVKIAPVKDPSEIEVVGFTIKATTMLEIDEIYNFYKNLASLYGYDFRDSPPARENDTYFEFYIDNNRIHIEVIPMVNYNAIYITAVIKDVQ